MTNLRNCGMMLRITKGDAILYQWRYLKVQLFMKFTAHSSDQLKQHVDLWLKSLQTDQEQEVEIKSSAQSEVWLRDQVREITLSVFYILKPKKG